MNDGSDKYYELLGVRPGTSGRELKDAYRDLAKVWHPDRFSHDPRLQRKAQEKLKEINEAYERLTGGGAGGRTRPAPDKPPTPAAAEVRRKRPLPALLMALVFCAVFFAALKSLAPRGARPAAGQTSTSEETKAATSDKKQQPDGETRAGAGQTARGKERVERQPNAEATSGERDSGPGAPPLRPVPTVTVTIDAVTGQLATRHCPIVSTVTFPAGGEPSMHCAAAHKPKEAAKGSRLKTVGKALAAPFRRPGSDGAGAAGARDARTAGGDGAKNR